MIRFFFFLWQPETITGDIVFVVQEKDHPRFSRKGDDLFVEHNLSLTEALCGFQFVLTHLDGRQLLIKSNPGEVVKPSKNHRIKINIIGVVSCCSKHVVRVFFFSLLRMGRFVQGD